MRQRDLMDVIEQVLAGPVLTKAEAEFLESIKTGSRRAGMSSRLVLQSWSGRGPKQFAQNSAHRSPEDP